MSDVQVEGNIWLLETLYNVGIDRDVLLKELGLAPVNTDVGDHVANRVRLDGSNKVELRITIYDVDNIVDHSLVPVKSTIVELELSNRGLRSAVAVWHVVDDEWNQDAPVGHALSKSSGGTDLWFEPAGSLEASVPDEGAGDLGNLLSTTSVELITLLAKRLSSAAHVGRVICLDIVEAIAEKVCRGLLRRRLALVEK